MNCGLELDDSMVSDIDRWRRLHMPDVKTRAPAIRSLIRLGLMAKHATILTETETQTDDADNESE